MFVPESCELSREVQREALTGVSIGQPLSRERTLNLDVDAFYSAEDSMQRRVIASVVAVQRGPRPWHVEKRFVREPGDLGFGSLDVSWVARVRKVRNLS
jgi:hypothetical protein